MAETPSLFDQAGEGVERHAAEERKRRETLFGRYIEIVSRHESPQPDDAQDLAALLTQLGIGRDQLEQDLNRIRKMVQLRQLHEGKQEANQRVIQARTALKALGKRHEEEQREAHRKAHRADCHLGHCHQAIFEADRLRRERPELFLPGDDIGFPHLCFEPEAAEAESE